MVAALELKGPFQTAGSLPVADASPFLDSAAAGGVGRKIFANALKSLISRKEIAAKSARFRLPLPRFSAS